MIAGAECENQAFTVNDSINPIFLTFMEPNKKSGDFHCTTGKSQEVQNQSNPSLKKEFGTFSENLYTPENFLPLSDVQPLDSCNHMATSLAAKAQLATSEAPHNGCGNNCSDDMSKILEDSWIVRRQRARGLNLPMTMSKLW